jgi:putative Mn2+ efflux pump MntP
MSLFIILSLRSTCRPILRGLQRSVLVAHVSVKLRTGRGIGTVGAITPVIGWAASVAASVHHGNRSLIAFTLLSVIGGKMLLDCMRRPAGWQSQAAFSGLRLLTAIGCSIDTWRLAYKPSLDANIVVDRAGHRAGSVVMTTIGSWSAA